MKLIFVQRIFSWFDSYDIYDEDDNVIFKVKGQLSLGHCFKIFDSKDREVAMVKERIIRYLPCYDIYINGQMIGSVHRKIAFFGSHYTIDYRDWDIKGDIFDWNYEIYYHDQLIASVAKKFFQFRDTYIIDVVNPNDALSVLTFALAMDAEKCRERRKSRLNDDDQEY